MEKALNMHLYTNFCSQDFQDKIYWCYLGPQYKHCFNYFIHRLCASLLHLTLRSHSAWWVRVKAFNHKTDYLTQGYDILNLKGHQNCIICSKVTAILLIPWIFFLLVELHRKKSYIIHCSALSWYPLENPLEVKLLKTGLWYHAICVIRYKEKKLVRQRGHHCCFNQISRGFAKVEKNYIF